VRENWGYFEMEIMMDVRGRVCGGELMAHGERGGYGVGEGGEPRMGGGVGCSLGELRREMGGGVLGLRFAGLARRGA
jgi:hypothetical protein